MRRHLFKNIKIFIMKHYPPNLCNMVDIFYKWKMFKNKIFNISKSGIYMDHELHHFFWKTTCPIILFWNKNKGDHYVLKFDIT